MFFSLGNYIKAGLICMCTSILPILFTGGCAFDPYDDTLGQSDTATYRISGTINDSSNIAVPVKGIRVFLADTTNLTQSTTYGVTDTTGYYSIAFSFTKKNKLQLKFVDPDPSTNGHYQPKIITLTFEESYFNNTSTTKTADTKLLKID